MNFIKNLFSGSSSSEVNPSGTSPSSGGGFFSLLSKIPFLPTCIRNNTAVQFWLGTGVYLRSPMGVTSDGRLVFLDGSQQNIVMQVNPGEPLFIHDVQWYDGKFHCISQSLQFPNHPTSDIDISILWDLEGNLKPRFAERVMAKNTNTNKIYPKRISVNSGCSCPVCKGWLSLMVIFAVSAFVFYFSRSIKWTACVFVFILLVSWWILKQPWKNLNTC